MLVDFSIENFRSFNEKQTITFEPSNDIKDLEDYYIIEIADPNPENPPLRLLKIGIVYGANASGKSNLLQAFSTLKNLAIKPSKNKTQKIDFEPFMLDYTQPTKFEINFVANQIKYNYQLTYNRDAILNESLNVYSSLTADEYQNIYTRTSDIEKKLVDIKFNPNQNIDDFIIKQLTISTLWNETVIAGFQKISADIEAIQNVDSWFYYFLEKTITPQSQLKINIIDTLACKEIQINDLKKLIRQADFNISDLRIEKEENKPQQDSFDLAPNILQLYITHTNGDKTFELPIEMESDGTQRYLGLAGFLLRLKNQPSFLKIDELESSLHPDLYEAFIITFLKNINNSQMLLTTHHREILQKKEILRTDALWIANKSKDSSTELYSFADFDASELNNLYKAYSIGKLGGTPNINSDLMYNCPQK